MAEDLDDGVAGVRFLDVAVERSGARPLRRELLLRALGDEHRRDGRDRDDQQRYRASIGLIQNIIARMPTIVAIEVMI
jgi:hypothetical protein